MRAAYSAIRRIQISLLAAQGPFLKDYPNPRTQIPSVVVVLLDDVIIRQLVDRVTSAFVRKGESTANNVARRQKLIPSFPWIAPGCRAGGGASKERSGIKFSSAA